VISPICLTPYPDLAYRARGCDLLGKSASLSKGHDRQPCESFRSPRHSSYSGGEADSWWASIAPSSAAGSEQRKPWQAAFLSHQFIYRAASRVPVCTTSMPGSCSKTYCRCRAQRFHTAVAPDRRLSIKEELDEHDATFPPKENSRECSLRRLNETP